MKKRLVAVLIGIGLMVASVQGVHGTTDAVGTVSGKYDGYRYTGTLSVTISSAHIKMTLKAETDTPVRPLNNVEVLGWAKCVCGKKYTLYRREEPATTLCEDEVLAADSCVFMDGMGEFVIEDISVGNKEVHL